MASPIVMPSFGMYTADGTLAAWLQPDGAAVTEGEAVLEIETDKALQEVPAPASGRLHHTLPVGTKLTEQMIIGYVLVEGEQAPADTQMPSPSPVASIVGSVADLAADRGPIKASPIARRLASERGIPLMTLHGSGPGGRIVEADVLAASSRAPAVAPVANSVVPVPWRVRERIPFTGIRRTIAERLKQSQTAAVSLTLQRELHAGKLTEARTEISRKEGVPVPFDAFFVKFLAHALREWPELNSVISGDELVLLDEVNVGFACSVPGGLVVPVIRDADSMAIIDIGRRIRELTGRARAGQLRTADIDGGTSTITNLGSFGIDSFTPILNLPQSSILGIGRILPRTVSDGGLIRELPTVWLSLTFDHRVTDGVPAAQVLDSIARQMNDDSYLHSLLAVA